MRKRIVSKSCEPGGGRIDEIVFAAICRECKLTTLCLARNFARLCDNCASNDLEYDQRRSYDHSVELMLQSIGPIEDVDMVLVEVGFRANAMRDADDERHSRLVADAASDGGMQAYVEQGILSPAEGRERTRQREVARNA